MADIQATVSGVNLTLTIPDGQLPSGADDQTAAEVPVAPVGSHNAVNVQEALESLNTADGEMAQDIQSLFNLAADQGDAIATKANAADVAAALALKADASVVASLDDDVTALAIDVAGKAPLAHTHVVADISDFPTPLQGEPGPAGPGMELLFDGTEPTEGEATTEPNDTIKIFHATGNVWRVVSGAWASAGIIKMPPPNFTTSKTVTIVEGQPSDVTITPSGTYPNLNLHFAFQHPF